MKAIALYNPNSDHARSVIEFTQNVERRSGKVIELISLETIQGSNMAELYDIVDYPAVLVIADNGSLHKLWEGSELPLIDELVSYLIA